MSEVDVKGLVRAASDRLVAVQALQRVVLDAIITLFVELGHSVSDQAISIAASSSAALPME